MSRPFCTRLEPFRLDSVSKPDFNQDHYQRWLIEPVPGPEYSLYCYPSKIIGSIVDGMTLHSKLSPEDNGRALTIARNAADYLIRFAEDQFVVWERPLPANCSALLNFRSQNQHRPETWMTPLCIGTIRLLYTHRCKCRQCDIGIPKGL